MTIKDEKIKFTVDIEVCCTESESFDSQKEFRDEEVRLFKTYLRDVLSVALEGRWQYGAKVKKFKIK